MAQSSRPSPLHRGSLHLDGTEPHGSVSARRHPSQLMYWEAYDYGYPRPEGPDFDEGGEGG